MDSTENAIGTVKLRINPALTASVEVDPQKGFTPLCPFELPVPGGDKIAGELNAQADAARIRVVSLDWHPPEAPWIAESVEEIQTPVDGDYPNLDIKWPAHCVAGTEGSELIPGLPTLDCYDNVVKKGIDPERHPYGACYHDLKNSESTGLIEHLRHEGIETVIVGGLATEYCVALTVAQLRAADFTVILNLAACRGLDEGAIDAALEGMEEIGVLFVANASLLKPVESVHPFMTSLGSALGGKEVNNRFLKANLPDMSVDSEREAFVREKMLSYFEGFMASRGWHEGVKLLAEMVALADRDEDFSREFKVWLFEGSTIRLRDNLASRFRDRYASDLDYHNTWTSLDTSRCRYTEEFNNCERKVV